MPSDEWETPNYVFDPLNKEFGFYLDAAASAENAKCLVFIDKEENAFDTSWGPGTTGISPFTVWLNPPYSKKAGPIAKWIDRALEQAQKHKITVVMLLPADTSTKWFHALWWLKNIGAMPRVEIRFLKKRVRFLQDGKPQGSPKFGSLAAVIRG